MALLRIEDVAKRYGGAQALDGVSLDVRRGELLTLLGASGCGKTTLLRVVAGFVAPDRGRVLLDGRDLGDAPPARRGFGFVFQNYALFPTKTVAANVEFGLRVRGVDRRARRARVEALCETVGLAGLERRYPHELSGGQQQRVALARALAPEPELLLLDEPLSALDARIRATLRDELSRLVRRLGVTAIYVTHDQTEALQLSDRIAVMRGGRVEQVGAPDEIYLRPANRFVAEFVGAVSIIACRRGVGGAPEPAAGAEPAMLIALRPEQVELRRDGPGWPATLEHAQFLGHAWRATLRLEDGQSLLADVTAPRWAGLAGAGLLRARIDAEAAATLAQPPVGRRAA